MTFEGHKMGYLFWATGLVAVAILVLQTTNDDAVQTASARLTEPMPVMSEPLAYARAEIGQPVSFELDPQNSALATAAFGMAALQPETFDKDMVIDIIDASPLSAIEKTQLFAGLRAAEVGRASLDGVLTDIRVALAVE